jgi:2,4-didehydro-3-deoxy-L-rhamnonate hydrolase
MYLMRIVPSGSERPVVQIDDTHHVDVADVVNDFEEAFFGSIGLTRLHDIVSERVADRRANRPTSSDSVHRLELPRPCRRNWIAGLQ